jgi:hypothetical protein
MSHSLLPIKAANMLFMDSGEQMASQLTYLRDEKPLTLPQFPLSECGCYCVHFLFTDKGCPYFGYG